MDRIQLLNKRIDELEKAVNERNEYAVKKIDSLIDFISDQKILDKSWIAKSLGFIAFISLFISGLALGWHWGWQVFTGIMAAGFAAEAL